MSNSNSCSLHSFVLHGECSSGVVDTVGAVLLLGGRLLALGHDVHVARQKQLRVGLPGGRLHKGPAHQVVLHHHCVCRRVRGRVVASALLGPAVGGDHGLGRCHAIFSLRVVMRVEFLDVQAAAALVGVDRPSNWGLNLNGLGPVALLRIELSAVSGRRHVVSEHHAGRILRVTVGSRHNGLAGRVKAEIRLIH